MGTIALPSADPHAQREDVHEQLEEETVHLVTASDVMGRSRQKVIAETCRSRVEPGNLPRKAQIEIAVNDEFLDSSVAAVTRGAHRDHRRAEDLRPRPRRLRAQPHR
jgi:nitrogen regulatory protein PII